MQKKEKNFEQIFKDKKINQNVFKFNFLKQNRENIENRQFFYYKKQEQNQVQTGLVQ